MPERWAWRIICGLAIVEAGAYIGTESPAQEYSHYFWDLTGYVVALDAEFTYRATRSFPFLYPPFAVDLFTLARSHLFELLSISYVAALALFASAYAQLPSPRKMLWLAGITAMGGMGVVSLQSGNVAILMNFTLLGVMIHAALGDQRCRHALPLVIAFGALIKPQFVLYLGVLPFIEPSLRGAIVKMAVAALGVAAVHGGYMLWRPFDWQEYTQGVVKRMLTERDWGWGTAAMGTHLSGAASAPYLGYAIGLVSAGALCLAAARRSRNVVPPVVKASLAFVALSFANPRLPLYDLYAAGVALIICCGYSRDSRVSWAFVIALAINLVPWGIQEFVRNPPAWPWWVKDELITHLSGILLLLLALGRSGLTTAAYAEASAENRFAARATLQG